MDPYQNALAQLHSVTEDLRKDYEDKSIFDDAVRKLEKPQRFIAKTLNINGKKYKAFRSQHNDALGPFKGGIRFHPEVTKEEVMALSLWMSIKTALVGIPFGGGKGGIKFDPKTTSQKELKLISKKYAKAFYKNFGAWRDIPAPDVNTNSQIMAWMLEEYERNVGMHSPAVFTGKPTSLGGSLGRDEATGQGGVYVLVNYAKKKKLIPKNTSVVVQGFGNVGYWFAKLASELGFKIILVSDSSGGIYDKNGLNIDNLHSAKEKYGSFLEVSKQEKLKFVSSEAVLTTETDILVPAALENVIDEKLAKSIKTKTVLELANGPTPPQAEEYLSKKFVDIIPDVLGNAGGVTVSYFEWVQNLDGYKWSVEKVNEELKIIMDKTFNEVYDLKETKKTTFRKAAYQIAVKRIIDAMILRGRV